MPTIDEIAKRANVSKTTVSFVINGRPGPSAATSAHVMRVMEEMQYVPSRLAQRFASQRSHTIALVFLPYPHVFSDNHHGQVLDSVYETLNASGYSLLLETSNQQFIDEKRYSTMIRSGMVDGVLLLEPTLDQTYVRELAEQKAPLAIINSDGAKFGVDSVRNDDAEVGRVVGRHLHKLGHRQLGFIAGSANHTSTRDRQRGFLEALEQVGITPQDGQIFSGEYGRSYWSGHQGCVDILRRRPETTAIFCCNDTMAVGALQAADELGRKVPRDLSIVGVDDNIISTYSRPAITTVRQPSNEIAKQAVELLLRRLGKKKVEFEPEHRLLKPIFIERKSTAPPAG